MTTLNVDVAVIGGGTAGLAARRAAGAAGARTVLINAPPWGTTCVRTGCMPSKLLLAAARAARDARAAAAFGVHCAPVRIDGREVMARVRRLRDHFLQDILKAVEALTPEERLDGHACFTGPGRLLVSGGREISARAVVIATGACTPLADAFAAASETLLTHETVFDLEDLPESLAVIGAGPVGLELACAFSRLGVRTVVFDRAERLGGLKDLEVEAVARQRLSEEVELQLGVDVRALGPGELAWRSSAGGSSQEERRERFGRILLAAGRRPNLADLNLAAAGLEMDAAGVPRFDPSTLQCGDSRVFIAGDADHFRPVLHEASRQGTQAGANAARPDRLGALPQMPALSIVFTDPDLAQIGEPLEALGPAAVAGSCGADVGRSRVENRPCGLVRLYAVRGEGRIRGGEMVGPAVEHMAHLVAFMVHHRLRVEEALEFPFYHPTFEEDLKDCLRDLKRGLA